MEQIKPYEQSFTIYSYLVDNKLDLTFPNLLCYLQEVAWAHSNKENVGWSFLQSKNMFWALTKFYLKIERMPKWEEKILIRTWAKPIEFIIHPRDFEVVDASGKILISATSDWVILDKDHFRPQKNVFEEEGKLILDRFAIEEKIPKIQKADLIGDYCFKPVLFSDIDMNQHVNNTRYLMWAIDDYDPDFVQSHRLVTCCINYVSQAKIGTKYAVKRKEIAPKQFIITIFTETERHELCRIQMDWMSR